MDYSNQDTMPKRTPGLVVNRVEDEFLVYALGRQEGLCLNKSTGLVLERCDGFTLRKQVEKELCAEFEDQDTEHLLSAVLDELSHHGLLSSPAHQGTTRRKFLTQLAPAVVPVIIAASMPTPVAAMSGASPSPSSSMLPPTPSPSMTPSPSSIAGPL